MFDEPEFLDRRIGDVSLHKLELFCTVTALGSVRRAAKLLYVTQPAISAQLKDLQERVGTQLLYWDGKQMRPTEAGERIYAWACELLTRTRDVVSEAEGYATGKRGRVVAATSLPVGPYLLHPILAEWGHDHLDVTICAPSYFPNRLAAVAAAGDCDFAITIEDESIVTEQGLDYEILGEEEIVLLARPDRPPASSEISAEEFSTLRLIGVPRQFVDPPAFLRTQLGPLGLLPLKFVGEFDHAEGIKQAVRQDIGLAFLTERAAQHELDQGELRVVRIRDVALSLPVILIRRHHRWLSPVQEGLLEIVRDGVTRLLNRP